MALFDIFKKKTPPTQKPQPTTTQARTSVLPKNATHNTMGEPLDRLTAEGELPFGWLSYHRDFTDKIEKEYTYFLDNWIASRNKTPKEQYQALKSFVLYLEDVEKLCKSKGECFVYWFREVQTSPDYLAKRKAELEKLEKNFATVEKEYIQKQQEQADHDRKVIEMRGMVIEKLKENDGILQSDFWKLFAKDDQSAVSDIVYGLTKDGKVERTKSGRSYILHYKG